MKLDTQICIAKKCLEKILHGTLMHILQAKALTAFVLGYLSKDV